MLKKTGRYDAFKLKWQDTYNDPPNVWPVPNHLFWDSDIAKWIEGASYYLKDHADPPMKQAVDELVKMITKAQQPDGYINIHFTVVEPGKRFTNLRDMHELYNAGHLIEAALAHHATFRSDSLLNPILKYVDLLVKIFGPGPNQIHGYPGHPEIELALLRLYRITKDKRHLDLATYFLSERGNSNGVDGKHFYDAEKEVRGDREGEWPVYYPRDHPYRYQQAHLPIVKQPTIEGHAVRAMYLLTAVADLCNLDSSQQPEYLSSISRLWANMVTKKMYLTGGIGAIGQWEGFGIDYFLPQGTDEGGCYAETCAAIGVVFLAERMLQLDLNGSYADVMELCLYNAVLTGMSHDGKAFTYTNQLASSEAELSERKDWFQCACCPPNMSRLFGYIGGFVWTAKTKGNAAELNVHLYTAASITIPLPHSQVNVVQKTEWPTDGHIAFFVEASPDDDVTIRLRIPAWATRWEIEPAVDHAVVENGYLTLPADWVRKYPQFNLNIPMKPRFIAPHPYTNQPIAAVARGPIVYCVEDVDHSWVDDHFKVSHIHLPFKLQLTMQQSVILDTKSLLEEIPRSDIFSDEAVVGIRAAHAASFLQLPNTYDPLESAPRRSIQPHRTETLNFIPYYARANRCGKGMMRVGLRLK
ncbi:glycoside hydrolase family 127 protein [Acidomyces richmondensis BFW]|nr:glycoside hydrolase family 127 protein [Acidomyces richmondensis BFW]